MSSIIKDLRFAIRGLAKRRSFAVIVILVLGLGIGSTTAIFSIVDALLLRSLPYPNADRLVLLREVNSKGNQLGLSKPNFGDLKEQSRSFEHLGSAAGSFALAVTNGATGGSTRISYASNEFFATMNAQPIVGRTFSSEEQIYGGPCAAIVSYGYWQKSLGGSTDFSSMRLNIDGVTTNVVGVMPPQFDYPAETEIWITSNTEPPNISRKAHGFPTIGLLRKGTTIDQARAEVTQIAKQLKQSYGSETDAADFAVIPLQTYLTRNVRQGLWLLLGSVGLLLLVACANFSNLLLTQVISRQREFTLRVALGASRLRLTRQVLIENLVLTLPGAALGILLASFGVRLLMVLENGTLPQVNPISIDGRVLSFASALGIVIAIALSFLPGLGSRRDLTAGLKAGSRGQTGSNASRRLRAALVVGQIGLTLVLLTGAGLLGRSFLNVMSVKPGFELDHTLAMTLTLPTTITVEEDEQIRQFYSQLLERVGQLPGVTAVGGINVLPLQGSGGNGQFMIDNDPNQTGTATYRVASGGYFSAMQIPLLRGRVFDGSDKVNGQHVAVVSESMAKRYWPNGDAIGKRIQFGSMDTDKHLMEIVGIVGDIRENLERPSEPTLYGFSLQRPQWWQVSRLAIVVRSQTDPETLIPTLRGTVQSLRPDTPPTFATLNQVMSESINGRRFSLTLFGVFAGVALLITVIGLYGVLAYSVTERTREMGIRMALGAQRVNVLLLVLNQGVRLAAVGIAIGLAGAWGLTRLMSTMLFGVKPTDAVTLVGVGFGLIVVSLLACYVPARRATKVDPLVALREE